jgi:hypothetical protein
MTALKAGDRVRALATLGLVSESGWRDRFTAKVDPGAEGTVLPPTKGDLDGWHAVRFDGYPDHYGPVAPGHVELVVQEGNTGG